MRPASPGATHDLGPLPEPQLNALGKMYKARYNIAEGMATDDPSFFRQLRDVADHANRANPADEVALLSALESVHASIRYWAVIGLAGLASGVAQQALQGALRDQAAVVRIAAAGALLQKDVAAAEAVELLRGELQNPHEWVRLHAAIALDEAGEAARPALHELQAAIEDRENKYVVRVANHAVNELLGTDNDVR